MASDLRPLVHVGVVALAGCALSGCRPLLSAFGFYNRVATARPSSSRPLPAFAFRGLRPGVTTFAQSRRSLALHYCSESAGVGNCDLRSPLVGGVYAMQASAVFAKGVLSGIQITYPSAAYSRLRRSVILAYGKPCEVVPGISGGKRTGAATSWCFRDGKLMLVEYEGPDGGRDTGSLDFVLAKPDEPARSYGKSTL
jgi:hypothetical protein